MTEVYIYDAVRTPRGKGRPGGSLSTVAPVELIAQLVKALEARNGREVVHAAGAFTLGCVTQVAAQGGHIALASRIRAGLPDDLPVLTINNFCVSGLSAVADAARRVACGDAELALAGGVESMSQVEFMTDKATYYADMGQASAMGWAPVGVAADLLATAEGIDRAAMDEAVLRSHQRAAQAWADGRYADRVVAVTQPDGSVALAHDENIRDFGDGASLRKLAPVFAPFGAAGFDDILVRHRPDIGSVDHRHTVAHCPPISDGAAMVLVGSKAAGERHGLTPLARICAAAEAAGDRVMQLTAGFTALDKALDRAGLDLGSVGAVEFMEAFAAVPVKLERDRAPDMAKVNVNGGHLAMGHPMGATGAILLGTLIDVMRQTDVETGVVAATGGVGVGAAMVLERT